MSLFEGMKFVFIPSGLNLTKKRSEIMGDNVAKRGGKIIPLATFNWNGLASRDTTIITSKDITYEVIFKYLYSEVDHYKFDSSYKSA